MSKEYPTIQETEAYDQGFADAEDYWRPKEKARLIAKLHDMATHLMFEHNSSYYLFEAVKRLEAEDDNK